MTDTNIKCLKQTTTQQLFAYTPQMASRPDMVPYDGPRKTKQSQTNVASEATLEAKVAETNAMVEKMLRDTQGQLDQANVKSAADRKAYEDENVALRERIRQLEAASGDVATPVPPVRVGLGEPEEGMEVVATSADHTAVTPEPKPAAKSEWPVPDNAEVIAHTDTPVATTSAPAAPAAPAAPPAATTPAAPAAPVIPAVPPAIAALGEQLS